LLTGALIAFEDHESPVRSDATAPNDSAKLPPSISLTIVCVINPQKISGTDYARINTESVRDRTYTAQGEMSPGKSASAEIAARLAI